MTISENVYTIICMIKNSGENGDGGQDSLEIKSVAFGTEAVHLTPDGPLATGTAFSENMSAEEVREVLAEVHDVDPGDVEVRSFDGKQQSSGRNRAFGAFAIWNSSWMTEADRLKGDPTLN